MLLAESYKLLIKQKTLIVIVIMVVIKIAFTFYQGYESHIIIDNNPDGYAYYIKLFNGKINDRVEKALQEEYYSVSHARAELDDMANKWRNGKLNREQYEEAAKKCYQRIKNNAVFNLLYNQYYYAKEDPTQRYIMDPRGWNTLLCKNKIDFILILCLIIIFTPVFCSEYESDMDLLMLSSSRGRYKAGIAKLFIGFTLAALLCALFCAIEFYCIDYMVGLDNGDFPLQSLEFFKGSEYHISIYNAFLLVILTRILGCILLTEFIFILSILSKKTIITLIISSVIVIFPAIFFQGKSLLFHLPLPDGLIIGTGYLRGTSYTTTFNQQGNIEKLIDFQLISIKEFIFLLIGYMVEIIFLFFYIIKKYSRYTLKHRIHKKIVGLCLYLFAITCTILAGCNVQDEKQENFTFYAGEDRTKGKTSEYSLFLDESKNVITAENLKTGEIITITREPFEQETVIASIFVHDEWCYYLTYTEGVEGIRIYGIEMKNFRKKLIYNSVKENNENFFGIVSEKNDYYKTLKYISQYYSFFLNENYIYLVKDNELIRIDIKSKKETVIALDVKFEDKLIFHNGNIYFIDSQYRLNIYDEKFNKVNTIESVYTDSFTIEGDHIKYKSLIDNKKELYYQLNG